MDVTAKISFESTRLRREGRWGLWRHTILESLRNFVRDARRFRFPVAGNVVAEPRVRIGIVSMPEQTSTNKVEMLAVPTPYGLARDVERPIPHGEILVGERFRTVCTALASDFPVVQSPRGAEIANQSGCV